MLKNITNTTLLQGVNVGIQFIIMPWYVDKLGVSGYGQIGVALAMMQLLMLIVDYGFTLTAARNLARSEEKLTVASQLFSDITTIKVALFISGVVIITTATYLIYTPSAQMELIFIGYILVLGHTLMPTWLFLGMQEASKLLKLTIIPKILILPIVFFVIKTENDLILAMILQVVPTLCTAMLCIVVALRCNLIRLEKANLQRIKKEIENAWPLFKSSAAISATTSITPLIINCLSGSEGLGIFLIADKIRQGIQSVLTPISMVAYPRISKEFSVSEKLAFFIIKKIGICMILGVTVVALIIGLYSVEIVTVLFGGAAVEANKPLQILMIATILTFCNTILATYIMLPLGREKIYSKITIYVAMLNLIIMWPFVSKYSYTGAAIALAISDLVFLILMSADLLSSSTDYIRCEIRSSILYKVLTSEKYASKSKV